MKFGIARCEVRYDLSTQDGEADAGSSEEEIRLRGCQTGEEIGR